MFPSEMGGIGGIFITLSASPYGSVENGNPKTELIPVDTWVMFSFHSSMKGWEDGQSHALSNGPLLLVTRVERTTLVLPQKTEDETRDMSILPYMRDS